MLSRFVTYLKASYKVVYYPYSLQKNHTGVNGKTGLYVVRNAEAEYLTGRGNATNPNVPILTTKSVMVMIMKRRSVTSSVVQVCDFNHYCIGIAIR